MMTCAALTKPVDVPSVIVRPLGAFSFLAAPRDGSGFASSTGSGSSGMMRSPSLSYCNSPPPPAAGSGSSGIIKSPSLSYCSSPPAVSGAASSFTAGVGSALTTGAGSTSSSLSLSWRPLARPAVGSSSSLSLSCLPPRDSGSPPSTAAHPLPSSRIPMYCTARRSVSFASSSTLASTSLPRASKTTARSSSALFLFSSSSCALAANPASPSMIRIVPAPPPSCFGRFFFRFFFPSSPPGAPLDDGPDMYFFR